MGYIDVGLPDISSSNIKTAFKSVCDEGVDYSTDGLASEDTKAAIVKNMWLKNGVLTSRKLLEDTGFALDGDAVHAKIFCFGYEIIHAGTRLYAVNNDTCKELFSGLPDKDSFFVEFSGKLYLYCEYYLISVDRELKATEEMQYAPTFDADCDKGYGIVSMIKGFEPNHLAPIIKVYYTKENGGTDGIYRFPQNRDASRKFYFFVNDELLDEKYYTFDEQSVYIDREIAKQVGNVYSIVYYSVVNDDYAVFKKCSAIGGCKVGTAYGGGTIEGTRVICAGNPDFPGRYFCSELANPLWFKADSGGNAGNGTEDITAFSKQYSDLLIFTESTVNRMKYNYTSDNGGYFSVHTINSAVGCDMPGSVRSVENRTVFANSSEGIFIVDSTDNFDLLNILPISRNITDSDGVNGFFSVSEEERLPADSALHDSKYMLKMGDKVFIWDYGNSPYVSSSDYAKAARKLTWFEFDGFSGVDRIFSLGDSFFAVKKNKDGVLSVFAFSENGEKCRFIYRSASSNLSYPFHEKNVLVFRFDCKSKKNTSSYISFFADGKLFAKIKAELNPDKDGYAEFFARIPKYSARHFAFEIENADPDTGIMNIGFDYVLCKSNKHCLR